jgi:hypothetical protein
VAVVFRGVDRAATPSPRLDTVLAALVDEGLSVVAVPYVEGLAEETAARLSVVDAALVWVDPLSDDGDRRELDEVLREAAVSGVWVSTHPDVIDRLGTKEVLVATRNLSWGCDVHVYRSPAEFRHEFPERLAAHGVRVLKASRGNGGRTVWKVRLADGPPSSGVRPDTRVVVQHASVRDGSSTVIPLSELMEKCMAGFGAWGGCGRLIDQEFIAGVTHGIVRCYLVGAAVAGFARQYPEGAIPLGPLEVDAVSGPSPEAVMGLPSPKTMYPPDEPAFAELRERLITEWVPGVMTLLGLEPDDLPALWDVDLLLADPYRVSPNRPGNGAVLCEVNASSVIPFPPEAPALIAAHVSHALRRTGVSDPPGRHDGRQPVPRRAPER